MTATYPAHWEADVVLADGATAHVRPIQPGDDTRLVEFYARVSDEAKYFRFFAPYPKLSAKDVSRFTRVDHVSRVALIVTVGTEMIAVGRYESLGDGSAEVSFLVEDSHQGRGIGSILLEHLAQAARERGMQRFVADVLPRNRRMLSVFADAGYSVVNEVEDGISHLEFEILPTASSLAVTNSREHRAEARSIERVLTPRSVAVVGASRQAGKVGRSLVRHLVEGGFTGAIYAVNPQAREVAGMPAYARLTEIPGDVDLVLIAVPAEAVLSVVADCVGKGVKGLVVVSAGFAETGDELGQSRQDELVRTALANGIRVIGPNCLGVVNRDTAYSLNASLAPTVDLPPPGRVGLFAQSGALGTAILADGAARGLGLSTFVSAGNRADVSGNDLIQYWRDDPATDVVLLYLETFGNPRKFFRLARRISETKPVVAVKRGRWPGMPQEAFDAMFRQAGVISVATISEMFDVAQMLAFQPLPAGRRIAVIGNSDALCRLASDAADDAGLDIRYGTRDLGPGASANDYASALREAVSDPDVDSILAMYARTIDASTADEVADVLAGSAAAADKPIVSSFLGSKGVPVRLRVLDEHGVPGPGSVPSYPTVEEAVQVLGQVAGYAAWRARSHGAVPVLDDIRADDAKATIGEPSAPGVLSGEGLHDVLASYRIPLLPMIPAPTLDDALAALRDAGGEVVLKATAEHLRYRADLADVWRNIDNEVEMRDAWATMSRTLADPAEAHFVVQPMAPSGVPVTITATEDAAFGPVVSFGLSGVATELLGDRSYRIPPLTDVDAAAMVRDVRAAALLLGYRGGIIADLAALEDLLHRVSRLIDDLPEVARVELNPVLVREEGLSVVNASITVTPPAPRTGWYTRRLT